MTTYYLVSEKEYQLRKNEIGLTSLEWEKIVGNSKEIIKLLMKAKFNYQIELMKWSHRSKEEILYNKMDAMDDVIKSIESMEKWFMEYQKKETEKETE